MVSKSNALRGILHNKAIPMENLKVQTWLPCFDGFYNTLWEPQEDQEIDSINSERRAIGLKEIDFDDCQFDYDDYHNQVVKGIARYVERELKQFITSIEIEGIRSPREYNFYNDSADITVTLSEENIRAINKYLIDNRDDFAEYLQENYTSRSGFISSYQNTIEDFVGTNLEDTLQHKHKLGSILQFIARVEGIDTESLLSNVEANLSAINYNELTSPKKKRKKKQAK